MKIFYWGPYISKVATVKAIIESAKSLKKFTNKTDIICAANVICHIPNLEDLIKGINDLL